MIEVQLSSVLVDERSSRQRLELARVEGEGRFSMEVGLCEALALDRLVKGRRAPRPLTHELLATVLTRLEASLERVEVTRVERRDQGDVYFAELVVRRDGEPIRIDCRPTDGLGLALALGAAVYAAEDLLAEDLGPAAG